MVFSKSFSPVASNIWNNLPGHLPSVPTLPAFRKPLKYHLLLQAYIGSITPATSAALTICRPHSAFQRSAYDQQFCTHTGACANAALLIYLLDGESFG